MADYLYSPWRLKYILSQKEKGCIFCIKPAAEDDEKHLILYRSELSYIIMNLFPYNNGHLLAVPNRHVPRLAELNDQEISDLFQSVRLCERILTNAYAPDGFNIGLNLGQAGGAGIESHLHVHIVPRWKGDTNFISVTDGIRVIPESFGSAYLRLKEQFDNAKPQK